jgi:7-carboxy-7-deazaguanine synthase
MKQPSKQPRKRLTEKTYTVHSMFLTIQGEGAHSGRRAVFVRFSGCNVWSGNDKDRMRDSSKGSCAMICDTKFAGVDKAKLGGRYTAAGLVKQALELWATDLLDSSPSHTPFVVFTGGEPMLQLDEALAYAFANHGFYTAVETNGSLGCPDYIMWVCVSPKPPMLVVPGLYDEVKVLHPLYNPAEFEHLSRMRWVQPVDVGDAEANTAAMGACVYYAATNSKWRLGIQLHKLVGVE